MPDVLSPPEFNERFTIDLNADGKPVQRTLREMTAGEVMQAIRWADREIGQIMAEADRLMVEAAHLNDANVTAADAPLLEKVYMDTPLSVGLPKWWRGGRAA
jgi:hypothetical protein